VRFRFRFTPAYRVPALLFGITPSTAYVEVTDDELLVRFGLFRLRTPLPNVESWEESGGFSFVKTAGPARGSFTDAGVTFATNPDAALCVLFHEPVSVLDPTSRFRHPGATMTVEDPQALADALSAAVPGQRGQRSRNVPN
jgi:hypothetical protein